MTTEDMIAKYKLIIKKYDAAKKLKFKNRIVAERDIKNIMFSINFPDSETSPTPTPTIYLEQFLRCEELIPGLMVFKLEITDGSCTDESCFEDITLFNTKLDEFLAIDIASINEFYEDYCDHKYISDWRVNTVYENNNLRGPIIEKARRALLDAQSKLKSLRSEYEAIKKQWDVHCAELDEDCQREIEGLMEEFAKDSIREFAHELTNELGVQSD